MRNIAASRVSLLDTQTSANVTQFVGTLDTKGFAYAQFVAAINAVQVLGDPTILEESDDQVTWDTVDGYTGGTDWDYGVVLAASNPRVVFGVNLQGRKRYLRATITPTASARGILLGVLAEGSDAVDSFPYPVAGQ